MGALHRVSRRKALQLGAAATALPLVHIRTGRAAGKLSVAFWDHWVPKGNDVLQSQVNTWAKQNQVDVTVDFITGNGGKLQTYRGRGVDGEDGSRHHDLRAVGCA